MKKEVTQWVGNSLHRNEILSCEEVELRRSSIGEGIALDAKIKLNNRLSGVANDCLHDFNKRFGRFLKPLHFTGFKFDSTEYTSNGSTTSDCRR